MISPWKEKKEADAISEIILGRFTHSFTSLYQFLQQIQDKETILAKYNSHP